MNVPDDLKTTCPNCSGKGAVDRLSFSDPSTVIQKACRVCKGEGWLWALDQQEMAERIGKLEAENARLSAPVTDAEWACVNYQQGFSTGILSTKEGEHTVMNWQQFTTRELIDALLAARKGAAS